MSLFSEADLEFSPEEVSHYNMASSRSGYSAFSGPCRSEPVLQCTLSLWQTVCMLQMEFFAEEEVITVIPNASFSTTDSSLICIGVHSLQVCYVDV